MRDILPLISIPLLGVALLRVFSLLCRSDDGGRRVAANYATLSARTAELAVRLVWHLACARAREMRGAHLQHAFFALCGLIVLAGSSLVTAHAASHAPLSGHGAALALGAGLWASFVELPGMGRRPPLQRVPPLAAIGTVWTLDVLVLGIALSGVVADAGLSAFVAAMAFVAAGDLASALLNLIDAAYEL